MRAIEPYHLNRWASAANTTHHYLQQQALPTCRGAVMHVRDDYGVGVILAPLRRRVDWTEPPAEGEWLEQPADQIGQD